MSDDSPFGQPAPTAQSVYPADTGATNIPLAQGFLRQHRGDMASRQPDIDATLSRMQLNTDSMTKMLDDTTAAIKASRNGRVNNPLLAMASGLLSSKGNFGEALGEGLGRMVPVIQNDRQEEDNVNFQLGQLALRRGALENLPLEKKLDYMKAIQVGDMSSVRAIEQALIRAQGTGTGKADKQALEENKLMGKTVQQALEEARKSVAQESTEMYATNDERLKAIRERFIQNIEVMRAAGVPVPQAAIDQVAKTMQSAPSSGTGTRKSYADAPTSPEAIQATVDAGLPMPPPVYEGMGPKDRVEERKRQAEAFAKETKDWDDTSKSQNEMLMKIERAEALLKTPNGRKATGRQFGGIPGGNGWLSPNLTKEAQELAGIFTGLQLHNVPKGQGAVSNLERELFEKSGANQGFEPEVNENILRIQKEIFKRDAERRKFFSEYYNHYKTTGNGDAVAQWERYINSPQGQAFRSEGSKIVSNERMDWREFFRKERSQSAGNRRDGGFIKLGAEFD